MPAKTASLSRPPRLVPRGVATEIVRIGHQRLFLRDLYAFILGLPWSVLLLAVAVCYILSNYAFALIYDKIGGVENVKNFSDAFFFSIQTMATIGYGRMTPIGFVPNLVVAIEALWGFAFFALVTGHIFAKFSRPIAHVLFSEVAVISDFEGKPHLKIRLANQRLNRIVDAKVELYLLRMVVTKEGYQMRRFFDLKLERDRVPLMQLTWTILHPIDEKSPLYGLTTEDLCRNEDEIIVALTGLDETLSQTIHAHYSYVADEIHFDTFFEDVLKRHEGKVVVDYTKFHSVRSVK